MPSGSGSAGRTTSPSSRWAPVRARWPRSILAATPASRRRRSSTPPSRCRQRQRGQHPDGRGLGRLARRRDRRRRAPAGWCSPTSCSTTCRSVSPCSTAGGARRSSSRATTASSPRCSARRSTRCRPMLPTSAPHGARVPLQDGARSVVEAFERLLDCRVGARLRLLPAARPRSSPELPWREWLRTYRGHERCWPLPLRPWLVRHHRRRGPRPATACRHSAYPSAVPRTVGHR